MLGNQGNEGGSLGVGRHIFPRQWACRGLQGQVSGSFCDYRVLLDGLVTIGWVIRYSSYIWKLFDGCVFADVITGDLV